jgi:plasmid stabilization system protein ParE
LRVSLRSEAAAEIARARSWYEDHKPGLGVAFEETLTATLGLIRENPKAFPVAHRDVRRALLHRFPYAVYYQLRRNSIRIVACLHQRRDRRSWEVGGDT